ncbi:MAG: PAS domain S-box protein, partial [Chloroflexota bacterium]|nr:PAS domain S-box protein [Chloroflexota bacterium]
MTEKRGRRDLGATIDDALHEAAGQVGQLRAANADLDAQRQSAEDDRARLRLAIETAGLVTWDLDLATQRIVYSPNVAAVVGFPAPTNTSDLVRLLHPEDRDELEARIKQAVDTGAPFAMDYRCVHPTTGEIVWLRDRGHVLGGRGAADRPCLMGVTQNITEQKRREQHAAFLADLGDDFARLSSADEIMHAVGEKMYRAFGLSRLVFAFIDEDADMVTTVYDKHDPGLISVLGNRRLWDHVTGDFLREFRAGRVAVVRDVTTDPRTVVSAAAFKRLGMRALLLAPYVQEGRWRFVIAMQKSEPYEWRGDEVEVIEKLAPRIHLYLERARAETAVREGEERFRTLFDSIDEGFCVIEVLFDAGGVPNDYRFLEVNPAFERQTGLHDAVGKTARELVPDLEEHWFQTYGEVATTGVPTRFVQEAQPMDHRWFDVYAFRLGEAESRRVGILFSDISERKRVEADIARLAAIVESSHDAIYRCQLDGTIVDWNRGAEELYGYTAVEIVGRDVAVLAPPEQAHEQVEFLRRLERGDDIPPLETVRRRKEGTLVEVEMRPSAVRDSAGHMVGIGVIARDVSARKRLERAQEDFLAMASHDLKSPVTVLRGRAQLMRRRKRYDEATVDAILEQARRIERLVTDLQAVVQLEAGTTALRRMPTDLGRLAHDAIDRIR